MKYKMSAVFLEKSLCILERNKEKQKKKKNENK
jgi:hypothetical protein